MRQAAAVILIVCFQCRAIAQDGFVTEPEHLVGISSGMSTHMVWDDIISPLMYKGTQIPILLTFDYRSGNNRHSFVASYDYLKLTSSVTDVATASHFANNLNVSLDYSYNAHLFVLQNVRTEGFLGFRLSNFLNWRKFYYSRGTNALSFEGISSLAFDALLEMKPIRPSGDVLALRIGVPILSYAVPGDRYNSMVSDTFTNLDPEKGIAGQILADGALVTVDRLFKLQTELSYTASLGGSIGVRVQYRFQYYSFAQRANLSFARSITSEMLIGLIVRL